MEDPSIATLIFFYEDGTRIAHTTTVEDLIRSTLIVSINDAKFKISVPPPSHAGKTTDIDHDNVLTVDDVSSLVQRGYFYKLRTKLQEDPRNFITVEEYFRWAHDFGVDRQSAQLLLRALHTSAVVLHFEANPQLEKYIFLKPDVLLFSVADSIGLKLLSKADGTNTAALNRIEAEIAPLDQQKQHFDNIARKSANRLMLAGCVYLLIQFGILAHMVWIDFNWDIMEPITYFVTLTTAIIGFAFFVRSKQDYTYPALFQRFADKKLRALYIANRFNWKRWNELDQKRSDLRKKLGVLGASNNQSSL